MLSSGSKLYLLCISLKFYSTHLPGMASAPPSNCSRVLIRIWTMQPGLRKTHARVTLQFKIKAKKRWGNGTWDYDIQVLENFPTSSHKSRYLFRKGNCQLSIGRKESATCWWNDIEWTSACVLVCSGQMSQSGNICRLLFFFEVTLNEPLRVFWSLA